MKPSNTRHVSVSLKTVLRPALAQARAIRRELHGFGRAVHVFRTSAGEGLTERRHLGLLTCARAYVRQTGRVR